MLFMWQNKSFLKKLSFDKIDVSTTNQCYIKKNIRDWDKLKENYEHKESHKDFEN